MLSENQQQAVHQLATRLEGKTVADIKKILIDAMEFEDRLDYDAFVNEMWIYKPAEHGGMPELGYIALGIAGEAGEVAEKVKKAYREKNGTVDKEAVVKELGDVLYYVVKLGNLLGVNLAGIAEANVKKLKDRTARGVRHGEGDNR